MRGFAVALSAMLVSSIGTSASAAQPRDAAVHVVGRNVFTSSGATAVPLLVERPFTIDPSAGGLSIEYSAAWAAVYVVHQEARGKRPMHPWMFGVLAQRPPVGCAAGVPSPAVCADRRGLRMAVNLPQSTEGRAGRFPAGRYVVYLLTSPGGRLRATWSLAGLRGAGLISGRVPVAASWQADRVSGAATATARGVRQQCRPPGAWDHREGGSAMSMGPPVRQ